jgi:UDP-3-O-acyl N-acetylglucosamine deacetylase
MRLEPGEPGWGIVFLRSDLSAPCPIPARLSQVAATERRTALHQGGQRVETVEHLLAAALAAEIDDLTVYLDGPEVPILDGSFAPFLALLEDAGFAENPGARRGLRLDHAVEVEEHGACYRLEPDPQLTVAVSLDYAEPVIGRQAAELRLGLEAFREQVAPARTFGFLAEVAPLRARGLLAGANYDCALVLSDTAVLNPPLRWPNEFARHKAGDLLGDLALLGGPLQARISAHRPSHRGNLACARALERAARTMEV